MKQTDNACILSDIYHAITEIIDEKGLTAVTFSSVAERCFRHKTAIAYYFKGKDDMLAQYFIYTQQQLDYNIPHLYDGCDPVEVFCDFIDNRIQMACRSLPWLRAKYQFLLMTPPQDKSLLQFTVYASTTQYAQIQPFIEAGIISPERLHMSMAHWYAYCAGLRFQLLFGNQPLYLDYVLTEGAEFLKRSFLKDGLYPHDVSSTDKLAAPSSPDNP